ncbi:MAG TPA: methylthioribulose 1-phosphate dehydratase [Methylophilaceae bacterium]|nr:methylthioribulose 1-phosphate dehydratase [Methylophilaceae bacterium]HAJ71561.1 methylthioribulose 1-phosphate dehydratase [Methylophilaceae bacterium]
MNDLVKKGGRKDRLYNVDEIQTKAQELVNAGRYIHSLGWVPATSGNFSARIDETRIAITVSGKHKGYLTSDDIMQVDLQGISLDGKKPSAETLLHTTLYQRDAGIGAVLHPHSPASTLISRLIKNELVLENYELLKALPNIKTHESRVIIPIFPNDQNIARLAGEVEAYMRTHADMVGYIIAGHGFYTWGDTVNDALRHVEALEFLFNQEIQLLKLRQ